MKGDEFGDRMKMLEKMEAGKRCMPLLPIVARLDGKSFSRFTRGLNRPYDVGFVELMKFVTCRLVEETGARVGYTQSDEISLVFYSGTYKSQVFFDGRIQKMCSVLASMATAYFNCFEREKYLPSKVGVGPAFFDCRVWSVPTLEEAANAILWRERDATKNAIQSAVRTVCSHKEVNGKNTKQMQEMLFQNGINFNDYPAFFTRGSFFQRRTIRRAFTDEEINNLPEKHEARTNHSLEVERSVVLHVEDMPSFDKVINRPGVVCLGEEFQKVSGCENE